MRQIEIEDGLRVRFPGRCDEFDDGVEVGIVVALMCAVGGPFDRQIATGNLDQVRTLAERLGYHLVIGPSGEGHSAVEFRTGRLRPKLTLAYSRPDAEPRNPAPVLDGRPARRSAPPLMQLLEGAALS